MSQLVEII